MKRRQFVQTVGAGSVLGAMGMLLAALLVFTLVFIPISVGIFVTVTIWLIYRIGKGWMRLRDRLPMYE